MHEGQGVDFAPTPDLNSNKVVRGLIGNPLTTTSLASSGDVLAKLLVELVPVREQGPQRDDGGVESGTTLAEGGARKG